MKQAPIFASLCALLFCMGAALSIGAAELAPESLRLVIWELRLPRILAAVLVGAGLAAAGVSMQALLRNPLADPYLLGLSGGAALGAVLGILFFSGLLAPNLCAAAGALGAALLVLALARAPSEEAAGRGALALSRVLRIEAAPGRLLLAGVAVAAVLASCTSFLLQVAPRSNALRAALFQGAGSLGAVSLQSLAWAAPPVALALLWLWRRGRDLDRMLLGEESARSMGVPAARLRLQLILFSSLLTGILVALAGAIGFVGLVAPHVARMLVGPGHRRLLPLAALLGALLLLLADTAARAAFAPRELPTGVLTAALGGPFFLLLLRRRAYGFGGLEG